MKYAFINLRESSDDEEDSVIAKWFNEFKIKAERMMKGYSAAEIDRLAKKVASIDSEVSKRETIKEIESALSDAVKTKSTTKDENTKKEATMQIELLNQLHHKASSFSIIGSSVRSLYIQLTYHLKH